MEPYGNEDLSYLGSMAEPNANSSNRDPAFMVDGHSPEHIYWYCDAAGNCIGACARYAPGTLCEKKTFRQFRAIATSVGDKFIPGLDGMALPIYRFDEITSDAERELFIVEGEKDVDLLMDAGLLATTSPMGAGKWTAEHTATIAGRTVFVIPDNDAPGHSHAEHVASVLTEAGCKVKVVDLPEWEGKTEGADVSDWFELEGTIEKLIELTEQTNWWESTAWPTPKALHPQLEAAPYPVDHLPDTMRVFSLAVAEHMKVDVAAPASLMETVLSTAAGNFFSVKVNNGYSEPVLSRFVTWVAKPGERKSATFRKVCEPLDTWASLRKTAYDQALQFACSQHKVQEKVAQKHEQAAGKEELEHARRELIELAASERGKKIALPPSPPLYTNDVTPERLVQLMDEHAGCYSVMAADARTQMSVIMGRYDAHGETREDVYLQAHAGDTISRARIGTEVAAEACNIERPALALGFCVQPDILKQIANRKTLADSGFIQRLNIIYPLSRFGYRIEEANETAIPSQVLEAWESVVHGILQYTVDGREMCDGFTEKLSLDPEAMEARRIFANEVEINMRDGGPYEYCRGFASKLAGEVARLAALFHLAEQTWPMSYDTDEGDWMEIPLETWQRAEAVQMYHFKETLRCLGLAMVPDRVLGASKVLDWCRRKEINALATRELLAAGIFPKGTSASDIKTFMETLVEYGWARESCSSASSRRAPRWEIHPETFGGNDEA